MIANSANWKDINDSKSKCNKEVEVFKSFVFTLLS